MRIRDFVSVTMANVECKFIIEPEVIYRNIIEPCPQDSPNGIFVLMAPGGKIEFTRYFICQSDENAFPQEWILRSKTTEFDSIFIVQEKSRQSMLKKVIKTYIQAGYDYILREGITYSKEILEHTEDTLEYNTAL